MNGERYMILRWISRWRWIVDEAAGIYPGFFNRGEGVLNLTNIKS